MSVIVALGERRRVDAYAVAGVRVVAAENRTDARAAWERLGPDVAVVLLTPSAYDFLADVLSSRTEMLWTVIPD